MCPSGSVSSQPGTWISDQQLLLSGGEGLGHSQGRTQLWGAGAAFTEAQRAGRTEGKLLLWLLLGSLSKASARHACQRRSDVLLATRASLSRASGSTSAGNGGAGPSHLPAAACRPGRGGHFPARAAPEAVANERSFLAIPVAVDDFSVLKLVCVLTCPLQYPYRYICCVPYEMLGSGKSTHRRPVVLHL